MNAINVGNPSARAVTWLLIEEFTLVRSPINVINVKDPLTVALTLLRTEELTLEKNHIDAMNVGKHLMRVRPLLYI